MAEQGDNQKPSVGQIFQSIFVKSWLGTLQTLDNNGAGIAGGLAFVGLFVLYFAKDMASKRPDYLWTHVLFGIGAIFLMVAVFLAVHAYFHRAPSKPST